MPYMTFFHAADGTDREDLHTWLTNTLGPSTALSDGQLTRLDIQLAQPRPAGFNMPADMELTSDDAPSTPYDGVLVLDGSDAAVRKVLDGEFADRTSTRHTYRVTEKVIFDKGVRRGLPTPGVKFLLSLKFHSDMPESAIRRSWHAHEPLAERVHVGSDRYVQWWVDAAVTAEAPAIEGVVEMNFPTEDDLVHRFFDSERGELEIVQDSAHFIAGGHPRVYLAEYVFGS
ncbi:hypothetical protein ACIREM_41105 [Streptomyces shenzhenensis]|uniref:hypothetical protein n=1 Tax=Streptomyces shenzhenensis TaxID=943815 RepID=UPI003815AF79